MSALPSESEQVHRYTVPEYDELGFFEDARVELIDGLVLDMSPKSPAHENVIEWLIDWLTARIDRSRFRVRVASSLQTSDSQPEPDLAVVDRDRPKGQRPRRAHLVIEVAHSSRHQCSSPLCTPRPQTSTGGSSWTTARWSCTATQARAAIARSPSTDPARRSPRRRSAPSRSRFAGLFDAA